MPLSFVDGAPGRAWRHGRYGRAFPVLDAGRSNLQPHVAFGLMPSPSASRADTADASGSASTMAFSRCGDLLSSLETPHAVQNFSPSRSRVPPAAGPLSLLRRDHVGHAARRCGPSRTDASRRPSVAVHRRTPRRPLRGRTRCPAQRGGCLSPLQPDPAQAQGRARAGGVSRRGSASRGARSLARRVGVSARPAGAWRTKRTCASVAG